jgi:hypothetical protein
MQATASSPLERDFIQLSDAYCSSVCIDYEEQSIGEIVLQFEGVPFDKLQLIRPRYSILVVYHVMMIDYSKQRLQVCSLTTVWTWNDSDLSLIDAFANRYQLSVTFVIISKANILVGNVATQYCIRYDDR